MEQPNNPYAASQVTFSSSNDFVDEYQLASRGSRFLACIVDLLCVGGIGILAAILIPSAAQGSGALGPIAVLLCGAAGLGLVIYNLILINRNGQTIGKRALKIKVVRSDGSPCTLGRYLGLRIIVMGLIESIPFIGGVISLIDPLLIFRDNYKCLHDEIADTIVVEDR